MQTKLSVFCDRVIESGWLAAAAVTPAFFNVFSSRVFEPDKLTVLRCIVLVMVIAWLIGTAETTRSLGTSWSDIKEGVRRNPLAVPALIFAGVYIFATLTSVAPAISFWGSYQRMQGTLVNLSYITLFFLTASRLRTRQQLDRLITVILLTSLVVALYGIIQHNRLDPLHWGGDVSDRVTSSLGNAIFCAAYLIMAVPLTLVRLVLSLHAFWLRVTARQRALTGRKLDEERLTGSSPVISLLLACFYLFLLTIQLTAILYTESRGPWMGLVAGAWVLFFLLALRARQKVLAAGMVGLAVLGAVFIQQLGTPGSPFYSLQKIHPNIARLGSMMDADSGTIKVRTLIWAGDKTGGGAIGLIRSNPLRTIVGWGPETMFLVYNPFYPPDLAHFEARNATPDRSHNDFLDYLVTMGVIGLAAYLSVVGVFLYQGLRFLWRAETWYERLIAAALIATVVGHIIETLTGIAIAATRTHFWLFMAAMVYLITAARQKVLATAPASETSNLENRIAARPVLVAAGSTRPVASRSKVATKGRRPIAPPPPNELVKNPRPTDDDWFGNLWRYLPLTVYLLFTFALLTGLGSAKGGLLTTMDSGLLRDVLGMPKDQPMYPDTLVATGMIWLLVGLLTTIPILIRHDTPRLIWSAMNGSNAEVFGRALAYLGVIAVGGLVLFNVFLTVLTADVYFKWGQTFFDQGQIASSVPYYLDAVRLQRRQDFYYLFLGRSYLELGKTVPETTAPSQIRKVDDLFIKTVEYRAGSAVKVLSRSLTRNDFLQASYVSLLRAYEVNPLNTDNSANLGRMNRYWIDFTNDPVKKKEYLNASLRYFEQATKLSPNAAHLYDEWGSVLQSQGIMDQAIVKYKRSIELDPLYPPPYGHLVDLYSATKQPEQVETLLKKTIRDYPKFLDSYTLLGRQYLQQNRPADALPLWQKAAELAPADLSIHLNLVALYRQTAMPDKALSEALLAVKLGPNDAAAHQDLALVYGDAGMIDKAISETQVAIRLAPPDQQAQLKAMLDDLQKKKK